MSVMIPPQRAGGNFEQYEDQRAILTECSGSIHGIITVDFTDRDPKPWDKEVMVQGFFCSVRE